MVAEIFVKQLDGCAFHSGGENCTAASEAMWLYRASQGGIKMTSCQVRTETNDDINGLRLEQVEAVSIHHGITGGKLYKPTAFATVEKLVQTGRYGSIIQIDYSPIANTKYDCFEGNFRDGHAGYVSMGTSTTARWGDPGADGRRPGIPKGYQDIPWTILQRAAGLLVIDANGETMNQRYGPGHVFAYVTPADPVFPTQKYTVHIDGYVAIYAAPNGIRTGAVSQATYICTRSKVNGAWWYHIKATASGQPSKNVGRYFQPNRFTQAVGR